MRTVGLREAETGPLGAGQARDPLLQRPIARRPARCPRIRAAVARISRLCRWIVARRWVRTAGKDEAEEWAHGGQASADDGKAAFDDGPHAGTNKLESRVLGGNVERANEFIKS